MKVVRWVYNALNRFVRRINQTMITSTFIALAVTAIPIAFFLLSTPVARHWSAILAVIGFSSLIIAVFRANKEDKEAKITRNGLRQDIRDLINEIRQDRKGSSK